MSTVFLAEMLKNAIVSEEAVRLAHLGFCPKCSAQRLRPLLETDFFSAKACGACESLILLESVAQRMTPHPKPDEKTDEQKAFRCLVCGRHTMKPRIDFTMAVKERCEDLCCDGPLEEAPKA